MPTWPLSFVPLLLFHALLSDRLQPLSRTLLAGKPPPAADQQHICPTPLFGAHVGNPARARSLTAAMDGERRRRAAMDGERRRRAARRVEPQIRHTTGALLCSPRTTRLRHPSSRCAPSSSTPTGAPPLRAPPAPVPPPTPSRDLEVELLLVPGKYGPRLRGSRSSRRPWHEARSSPTRSCSSRCKRPSAAWTWPSTRRWISQG
ncbi:uncharacterized protein LOC106866500 [Brachypodium distachyon]|uniref:Uncharacterized protein n=1 Tax=Brachypodium distachyon TaxID=15368 RepID=A0A2K2D282_BRADI|nr:uncharacterized protein LOC106866500 [Brachypodium distachyon]PNT68375.1 hypothetical protein BRADI_3g39695v3 [Brachypodium distachyon]|eukprot:XP_014756245.1 uncharacterized protein LOC106866500 [Brachypodium distachyon]